MGEQHAIKKALIGQRLQCLVLPGDREQAHQLGSVAVPLAGPAHATVLEQAGQQLVKISPCQ